MMWRVPFVARGLAAGFLLLAVQPAGAQVLRYGGEPGSSHAYLREQRDRIVQTFQGRQAATDIRSAWRLRATVSAATPETLSLEVVHDSLGLVVSPADEPIDLSGVEGLPIAIVMTRRGTVADVELPPDLPAAAARLDFESAYRAFFPRLPAGEAPEGATWSDTTRVATHQNGLDLRVVRVERYVRKGQATPGEGGAVRVDVESDLTIEGSGEQQDAGIVLRGTGRGTGGFLFDPERGVYLGGGEVLEMRMVALVTAGDQKFVLPIVQNRTETVTLLPQ